MENTFKWFAFYSIVLFSLKINYILLNIELIYFTNITFINVPVDYVLLSLYFKLVDFNEADSFLFWREQ